MLSLLIAMTLVQTVALFVDDIRPRDAIWQHFPKIRPEPDGGLTLTPANDLELDGRRLAA